MALALEHLSTDQIHHVARHTSVTTEDLLINDGGNRQTVETVRERLP